MSATNKNLAYDLSLFEENTGKKAVRTGNKNNIIKLSDEQLKRKRKHNPVLMIAFIIIGIAVTTVVGAMIRGQVQLTELNQKIISKSDELEEAKSMYTQMQMKVDAKFSAEFIQNYAVTELKMVRADDFQKTYIKLAQGDKAEILQQDEGSILKSLVDAISDLWS